MAEALSPGGAAVKLDMDDVHLVEGRRLILGGVEVPLTRACQVTPTRMCSCR